MGILRVYLALCVIAAHSHRVLPWRMHDGRQAVQIFYIISGFYMAMVLSTRYSSARDLYEPVHADLSAVLDRVHRDHHRQWA
jgi:peptidoglycan/LPS O-acetylase OafA/YrhL